MNAIRTYSGVLFDIENPKPEMVFIEDIAHGLSNLCRFAGQCTFFYSVAQHSVLVSDHVPAKHKLAALLHDATEAYCVDIPRPLKNLLPEYKAIEKRVAAAISERFSVDLVNLPKCVHEADDRTLATEQRDLMPGADLKRRPYPGRVQPWTSQVAERTFLRVASLFA